MTAEPLAIYAAVYLYCGFLMRRSASQSGAGQKLLLVVHCCCWQRRCGAKLKEPACVILQMLLTGDSEIPCSCRRCQSRPLGLLQKPLQLFVQSQAYAFIGLVPLGTGLARLSAQTLLPHTAASVSHQQGQLHAPPCASQQGTRLCSAEIVPLHGPAHGPVHCWLWIVIHSLMALC